MGMGKPACQMPVKKGDNAKQSQLNKIAQLHLQRMKDQQEAPPAGVDAVQDPQAPGQEGPANAKPSVTVNITHGPNADAGAPDDGDAAGGQSKAKKAQMAAMRSKGKAKGK